MCLSWRLKEVLKTHISLFEACKKGVSSCCELRRREHREHLPLGPSRSPHSQQQQLVAANNAGYLRHCSAWHEAERNRASYWNGTIGLADRILQELRKHMSILAHLPFKYKICFISIYVFICVRKQAKILNKQLQF